MVTLDSVTAISITHNSKHCIEALAKSLAALARIIIVDNGSRDDRDSDLSGTITHSYIYKDIEKYAKKSDQTLEADNLSTLQK